MYLSDLLLRALAVGLGDNNPSVLELTLIAMQGHQKNSKNETETM